MSGTHIGDDGDQEGEVVVTTSCESAYLPRQPRTRDVQSTQESPRQRANMSLRRIQYAIPPSVVCEGSCDLRAQ